MNSLIYLELEEVFEIHTQLIDLYGGKPGFRGEEGRGLVESALNRPKNKAIYDEADLLSQAASLFYGLAKNHGFLDGNKRIAVTACDVFLQDNGWELRCDNQVLIDFTLDCDKDFWTEHSVEAFVRRHAAPLEPS